MIWLKSKMVDLRGPIRGTSELRSAWRRCCRHWSLLLIPRSRLRRSNRFARLSHPVVADSTDQTAIAFAVVEVGYAPSVVVTKFPLEESQSGGVVVVEREPAVVRQVVPAYPDSGWVALVAGWVFARILVGREGRVKQVGCISGPLVFYQEFAMLAKEWEFTPAVSNE